MASPTDTHTAPTTPVTTIPASVGSQPKANSDARNSGTPTRDVATPFHSPSIIRSSTDSDEILSDYMRVSVSASVVARSSITVDCVSIHVTVASSGDADSTTQCQIKLWTAKSRHTMFRSTIYPHVSVFRQQGYKVQQRLVHCQAAPLSREVSAVCTHELKCYEIRLICQPFI